MSKSLDNKSILAAVNTLLAAENFYGKIVLHCEHGQILKVEQNRYDQPDVLITRAEKCLNETGKNNH